ncbi:unnamed protein product [Blepharisma stoltei]|uniref:Endonuclease/exonuclease/phosphatase domain-containing protein n=1 Tax=Blepharisma stoltei TaxID=1481888 RepID=A0AAU9III0_9CILI|nr:unnamed protein product [Blepharisma stoltei]
MNKNKWKLKYALRSYLSPEHMIFSALKILPIQCYISIFLISNISELLEDHEPTYQLAGPYLKDWIIINDDCSLQDYLKYTKKPIIYVTYPSIFYLGTPTIVRLQTYNLSSFNKDKKWEKRVEMLAKQIKIANPDIIGIQEARYDPYYGLCTFNRCLNRFIDNISCEKNGGKDMMKDLLAKLPEYPYSHWLEVMHFSNGIIDGIGIISRFPIIDIKSKKLSKTKEDKNIRACLRAAISHPNKKINVYNTQLTYDDKGQAKQLCDIIRFIDSEDDGETLQILMGDMNFKRGTGTLEGKNKGDKNLKDAWITLEGENDGNTYPSWNPKERMDRILYRNTEDPLLCELCGYAENEFDWPSDHCSLYADFLISL